MQPTHVPVKSRGSPVGHRGDVREGLHLSLETCPHLPPPLPTTEGAVKAGPGQSPGVPFPTISLGLLSGCWESPPSTSPTVPETALGPTPASEHQPPEGPPGAGRRGGQEAGQVDSFCRQPAEVGHGGEVGAGHRGLAQNLRAGTPMGARPSLPTPPCPLHLAAPEGMQG